MKKIINNFEVYFRAISYVVALCGLFSLFFSGGINLLVLSIFISVTILAWNIEGSRWQISERLGVILILVVLPLFIIDWKFNITGFGSSEILAVGSLARLILILSTIKLLQRKSDRDWIFIYTISFFEVLLAAGLSISPLYLVSLISYLLFTTCAIITFEIRKTSQTVIKTQDIDIEAKQTSLIDHSISIKQLAFVATAILIVVTFFAIPLFFFLPRVGGAGIGNNLNATNKITGFSDSVELGEIGRLQQNDKIVMRIRLDKDDNSSLNKLLWKGVALDTFSSNSWSKSTGNNKQSYVKDDENYFDIKSSTANGRNKTTQTVYLEPLNTDIIFHLPEAILVEGNFQIVNKDSEGAISAIRNGFERTSYKVISDRQTPAIKSLQEDNFEYPVEFSRYLQLPQKIDPRIEKLAKKVVAKAEAKTRYEKARALERFLQQEFSYTLELKAGGEEPLADFLFAVKEGHCEYFATAMAIMLRTQGVATRIVNGFQQGEYNETADVYVVRQLNAHSWVEVYFPETDSWIPFDPTPFAGQFSENSDTSLYSSVNSYLEALETFWIQYFVAYDNQEQQSMFRSLKSSFSAYKSSTESWITSLQAEFRQWWTEVRGDKGLRSSAIAIAYGVAYLIAAVLCVVLLIWIVKKIINLSIWRKLRNWIRRTDEVTRIIEFYERMQKILENQGFKRQSHQTPLEFAFALNIPEAIKITEKYNRIRFGEKALSKDESKEVESWLKKLESRDN